MLRLLSGLFVLITIGSYGQDTLATIFPRFKVADTETIFVGDTILVRFIYEKQKKSNQKSEAAWYSTTRKIVDADLDSMGSNILLGVKKFSDSIFYYTLNAKGKETEIETYKSAGFSVAKLSSITQIEGVLLKGLNRGNNFLIATWDKKLTAVRFYELHRDKIVNVRTQQLWPEIKKIKDEDMVFVSSEDPSRISASALPLKLYLFDDTFCAVLDSPKGISWLDQNGTYKTRVFRKNLVTGVEDNDVIMTTEKFTFKSFLCGANGSKLYRFASLNDACELAVHNLDNNRIAGKHTIAVNKGHDAITRLGLTHHIERAEMSRLSARSFNKNRDIGLTIDDYHGKDIVTIGMVDFKIDQDLIAPMPLEPSIVKAVLLLANIANHVLLYNEELNDITYTYLEGTATDGFNAVAAGGNNDFVKISIDNFELRNMADRALDYTAYWANNKYWIGLHSFVDSPRYYVTKFPIKP